MPFIETLINFTQLINVFGVPVDKRRMNNSSPTNGCIRDHPSAVLREKAHTWDCEITERSFAERLDADDPLKYLRQEFYYPQIGTLPEGRSSHGSIIYTI